MKELLISIIIPVFNGEKTIKKAIESALNQTHKQIEIIIIDNNSSDMTMLELKKFEQKHPSKIKILSEKKQGANAARNLGLNNSNGVLIQFLDADDELHPEKLKNQAMLLEKFELTSKFFIAAPYFKNYKSHSKKIDVNLLLFDSLLEGMCGCTCSNLYFKESLFQIGGWNEDLFSGQEYDLMLRLVKNEILPFMDKEYLTTINVQPISLSRPLSQKTTFNVTKNRIEYKNDLLKFFIASKSIPQNILCEKTSYSIYIDQLDFALNFGDSILHFKEKNILKRKPTLKELGLRSKVILFRKYCFYPKIIRVILSIIYFIYILPRIIMLRW